jgi:putative transposase
MPSKHTVKQYVEDGFYHVYNRGVEKRELFLDDQDYRVFLHLLKVYLSPVEIDKHPLTDLTGFKPVRFRPLSNLNKEVELLCFCLMPNHFHLLIKQSSLDGMSKLLRRVSTTYALYFNQRYSRVGHLFQGIYKAAIVLDEPYLLHLSRYIHLNPKELTRINPVNYPYSSYSYYSGQKTCDWLNTEFILSFFKKVDDPIVKGLRSYGEFVGGYLEDPRGIIGDLALESD